MTFWEQYKKYISSNIMFIGVYSQLNLITYCICKRIATGALPLVTPWEWSLHILGGVMGIALIGLLQVYVDRKYPQDD